MTVPRLVILAWLAWCAVQTHGYVGVWRSEVTLWAHAAAANPLMPRAQINYGKALVAAGQREHGIDVALRGYNMEVQRMNAKRAAGAPAR